MGGTSSRNRWIAVLLIVQLALVIVYWWTLNERTPVTVWSSGRHYGVQIGDSVVVARSYIQPRGAFGLYATDSSSLRNHLEPMGPADRVPAWFWPAWNWLMLGDADSAWDNLVVADANSGKVLFEASFHLLSRPSIDDGGGNWRVSWAGGYAPYSSGFAMIGETDLGDALIKADLLRGRAPAGFLIHFDGKGNGTLLEVRSEHSDVIWWSLQNGRLVGPLSGGRFQKSWVSALQGNIRLLLRSYFAGLVLLGGLALVHVLGTSARVLWQPVRFDLLHLQGGSTERDRPGSLDRRGRRCSPSVIKGQWGAPSRFDLAVSLAVFIAGLCVSGWVAYFVLERIPHVQDSVAYLFQAKTFALGRLWVPTPPGIEFFEHEFILDHDGRWFSKYPPGHALFLALGVLFGHHWLVNPLVGAGTLVAVYFLGKEVYSRGVGLLAAALGLLSPFWIFMSGSLMAHPTALFTVTLFALFFIRGQRGRGWGYYGLAGVCLGLALLIRPWTALALSAAFVIWAIVTVARRGPAMLRYYVLTAIVVGIFAGLLLAYNAQVTGNPLTNPQQLWWPFDRVGFGEGYGAYGRHTLADGLWNAQRNLSEMMTHLYGWPSYLTLAFVLLPFGLLRANRWDGLFAAAWLALVAAYVAWWADGVMYGPRFHYESLSFLLLLTARGVLAAGAVSADLGGVLLGRLRGRSAPGPASGLALVVVAMLMVVNLAFYLPIQWRLYHGYNYVSAEPINRVDKAGIRNAVVFTDTGERHEWWKYGAVFSSNSPLLDNDVLYARDLGEEKNRELMAMYPDRRYYLLSDHQLLEIKP